MIRRISKYNDLKDIITAKQPNVIENVDDIWYYIQGYPDNTISPEWSVSGEVINVIIPTDLLEELPNGILMRIVHYHKENADYPDGYYDLEIEDNMGIWLGEDESDKGEDGSPYVTESELNTTLSGYATQSWLSSNYASIPYVSQTIVLMTSGYLTSLSLSSLGYRTLSETKLDIQDTMDSFFVAWHWFKYCGVSKSYMSSVLSSYATQSWVSSQGYLTSHQDLTGYATQSWVEDKNYLTTESLTDYATESWVEGKGYPTASWVTSYVSSALSTYSYTETDPTVPSWAKSATKPTYTASEVSALALSAVWTGTSTEWEALTSAQQALYTIALITE